MRRVVTYLAVVLALLAGYAAWQPGPALTQTVTTTTTLAAAMAATDTSVALTSDSGVSAGTYIFVDKELFQAIDEVGTSARWNVRKVGGTSGAHASGARAFVGPGEAFSTNDVAGTCTASSDRYRPHVNTNNGRIWDCEQGLWLERHADPVYVSDYTVRDSFDAGYAIMQDDGTAQSVTDDEDNFVYGSPLGSIEYREELSKTTSSWVTAAGVLDVSADDATDNEGVEILFGAAELQGGFIRAGTTGGCIAASITIADISGTDQVVIGFRQNEAFQDNAAYAGHTVWNSVGVTATDGSINSQQEVSEATDADDSGVNWADGETRALKVCVSKAGVPTAYYSDAYTHSQTLTDYPVYNAITMTETGSTLTAGTALQGFLSYLAAGTDGPDVSINWVSFTRLP